MRRIPKSIQLRIGVFIFIGVLALSVTVLFIGNNQTLFSFTNKYKLSFQHVEGLFTGSLVTINGIPAGNVSSVYFMPEDGNVQVTVAIARKFASSITDRSEATLITKGVLGDKYISISTKGRAVGSVLPVGNYIATQSDKNFMSLLSSQEEAQKVSMILAELLVLLQTANAERAVRNIAEFFSGNHAKDMHDILMHFKSILKKLDQGEGTAGALINNKRIYNVILSYLGQRPYERYIPELVKEAKKK